MSFVKDKEQVGGGAFLGKDLVFSPSEVLTILYETKAEKIEKILPPPLEPYEKPYVLIAYNNFMDVNFDTGLRGPGYKETALYIPATYQGKLGTYVAAMTLNTDLGTTMGREITGYPKKMGTVDHSYKDDRYVAYSARHGIPYATLEGQMNEEPNDPDFLKELGKVLTSDPDRPGFGINWTFKWTPGLNGKVFMTQPLLVEGWKSKKDLAPSQVGRGKVQLVWSDDDPWADLEVVRVLGASLVNVESRLYVENVVTHPVDEKAFERYAFFGWDVKPGF